MGFGLIKISSGCGNVEVTLPYCKDNKSIALTLNYLRLLLHAVDYQGNGYLGMPLPCLISYFSLLHIIYTQAYTQLDSSLANLLLARAL